MKKIHVMEKKGAEKGRVYAEAGGLSKQIEIGPPFPRPLFHFEIGKRGHF
jgi:hypothetical protein